MTHKSYALVTASVFLVIAILHLLRVILGWTAVIAGWAMPMWMSWVALLVAAYLSYAGLRLSNR
jgi:hypothetical protein